MASHEAGCRHAQRACDLTALRLGNEILRQAQEDTWSWMPPRTDISLRRTATCHGNRDRLMCLHSRPANGDQQGTEAALHGLELPGQHLVMCDGVPQQTPSQAPNSPEVGVQQLARSTP